MNHRILTEIHVTIFGYTRDTNRSGKEKSFSTVFRNISFKRKLQSKRL